MSLTLPNTKRWYLIFGLWLLPLIYMAYLIAINQSGLGADPAKGLVDLSGEIAIYSLIIALSITPVRKLLHQGWLARFRRMSGLFAFFYAFCHFSFYSIFLLQLDLSRIGYEIANRPYILVGAAAVVLYLPLVATSTKAMQRRLKRNWVRLHKLVYVIAVLAVIHVIWLKKLGIYDAKLIASLMALLLGYRLVLAIKPRLFRKSSA